VIVQCKSNQELAGPLGLLAFKTESFLTDGDFGDSGLSTNLSALQVLHLRGLKFKFVSDVHFLGHPVGLPTAPPHHTRL
jgi:hypothetical protein